MQVQLDNLWSSPSTLHGRVTVWADDHTWRHRYDVHVPLAEIPAESITLLISHYLDTEPSEIYEEPLPGL